jgi:elongation factor P
MAILNYNEIIKRKYIDIDGEPFEVLDSWVFRKQQRKPVNQTKLKSLISGKVTERSFHATEKVEEADLDTGTIKYLYSAKGEHWFCDNENPQDRFTLDANVIGDALKYIPSNSTVNTLVYDEKIIGLKVPIKVELLVKEAPPAVRGNTAQGGSKQITLETGAIINGPLFINEGDYIRINTDTGEYVERVDNTKK